MDYAWAGAAIFFIIFPFNIFVNPTTHSFPAQQGPLPRGHGNLYFNGGLFVVCFCHCECCVPRGWLSECFKASSF